MEIHQIFAIKDLNKNNRKMLIFSDLGLLFLGYRFAMSQLVHSVAMYVC